MVNNITCPETIDFKTLRESFRGIDTSNSGIITIEQVKKGFRFDNHISYVNTADIEQLFSRLDFNKNGTINYSEFLAATVDKKLTLTRANL